MLRPRPVTVATVVLAFVAQTLALLALTIAPASAAPLGLQPGDLVVSDPGNSRLVIHPADGSADRYLTGFSDPQGLVVTPTGDIIVIEQGVSQIVKIAADGTESTLMSRSGINFLALDWDQNQVLFSGFGLGGIGRVKLDGSSPDSNYISGPTPPNYSGLAVARDGDVIGADWGDLVVRIDGIGSSFARAVVPEVSHEAGDSCSDPRPCNLRGLALTPDERILVADTWNDRIWESDGSGGATAFGTDLEDPFGVAVGVDGTVYATDQFGERVVAFAPGTRTQTDEITGLLGPTGIAVVPAPPAEVGDVVVGTTSGEVVRISADGSHQVTLAAGLGAVTDVAVDESGNVFAATTDGEVYLISADARWVDRILDQVSPVTALAAGPLEMLFFTDDPGGVHRWTDIDGVQDLASDDGSHLVGVTVDDDGLPYATSTGVVSRVQSGSLDPLAPDFVDSVGVVWDPAGRLLVAHRSQDQLVAVDPVTGAADVVALVDGIRDVTVAGDGRLLTISDGGDLVRVDADGSNPTVLTTVAGVRGIDTYVPRPSFTAGGPVTGTGNVGTAYTSYDFDASANGGGSVAFTLYSGALPPGLSLNPSSGVLSGTPTTAGSYSFRVRAANGARGVVTAPQTIVVGKQLQTITFTSSAAIGDRLPDRTYAPSATSTSGGTVVFSIDPLSSTICSYDSGTGLVTFLTGGACILRADQAGDADYEAAPRVTQNIAIGKLSQSAPVYNEPLPTGVRVGDTYTPTASVSGPGTSLPVVFGITGVFLPSFFDYPCLFDPGTGEVTFIHPGTCRIRAVRQGDARYNVATSAARDITVLPALLGFDVPGTPRAGEFHVLSSNDPDAYYDIDYLETDFDPDISDFVCTVGYDGALSAYVLYYNSPGTCVVTVTSDADYTPTSDSVTLTVLKAAQTVTFTSTAPTAAVVGDTYDPTATSTATGPVSFAIAAGSAGVCSVASGTVTFEHAGDCVVRAEHPGDDDFDAGSATQTIPVGKASQTVSFTSATPTAAVVGDTYTPGATATSGADVDITIAPASAGVCSLSGGVVTFEHVGDCVVRADQGGTADHLAAAREIQTITVGQAPQSVSFTSTAPASPVVGGDYTPTGTATSGLTVAFSVAPASSGVCSISGGVVSFEHVGDCVVRADQAGDADHLAATQVTQTITVDQGSQTISFTSTAPVGAAVGGDYTPTATASSGLAVAFSIAPASSGVCSISGGVVSFEHVGDCVVRANQAGDADYTAAGQETQTIPVGQGAQSISFLASPPTGVQVGDGLITHPTASSGLTVELSVAAASAGVCSLSGSTVEFQHVGDCVIHADQAGDDDWLPAPRVTRTITVGQADQWVTFDTTAPTAPVVGDTYTVAATATSGLTAALSVASASSGVCSISGGVVTFEHVGDCVVQADQAGDTDHLPATRETQTITVGQASQAIVFNSVPTAGLVGQTYDPSSAASASSGGAVTYSVAPASAGVCSISGGIVSYDHVGDCVIRLDQPGTADYLPAPQREMTVTVGRGAQAIVFTSTPASTTVGSTYVPAATGGASGMPVVFSIAPASAAVCSIVGGTVTFDGVGECVVRANQAGNADYEAAPQAVQAITAGHLTSVVTFITEPDDARVGQTYVPATITTPTVGTVELSVTGEDGVCSVEDGTVTFLHAGTCQVLAAFTPWAPTYSTSFATQTIEVGRADTETDLELMRDTLVATVTPADPSSPEGLVEFAVDGVVVGSAELEDVAGERVAFLVHTVPSTGAPHEVTATYAGSADHVGSSVTVTRVDPTLTAEVSSNKPVSEFGWYRTPVRITFTCEVGSAPLVGGCPSQIKLTKDRRGLRPISVRVDAEDGGSDQVDIADIRIDLTAPRLEVRGVEEGKVYNEKQTLRCVARDPLSGIDRCTVTQEVIRMKGRDEVRFTVVASDRAGNTTVERGRYYLR